MRRRLYFMLPDIPRARAMLDELLLARVEERYMHFYAGARELPDDMPQVGMLDRTNILHGAEAGLGIGATSGLFAGSLLFIFPPDDTAALQMRFLLVLLTACVSAIFGAWMSARVAAGFANSSLAKFREGIDQGQILLIIDLPYRRANEIRKMITTRHPEMQLRAPDIYTPQLS